MRWRIIEELRAGKGNTICANVSCVRTEGLDPMEVVFGYIEEGKKKNVLVKCVLCPRCRRKLKESYGKEESRRQRGSEDNKEESGGSKHRHHRHKRSPSNEHIKKRKKHRSHEPFEEAAVHKEDRS